MEAAKRMDSPGGVERQRSGVAGGRYMSMKGAAAFFFKNTGAITACVYLMGMTQEEKIVIMQGKA